MKQTYSSALRAVVAGLCLFAAQASAAPVYGTSAAGELTGSRSVAGGGLTDVGDTDWADTSISWTITLSGGLYTYTYTLEGYNRPGVSHFNVDLSPGCTASNGCVQDAEFKGADINSSKVEFGVKDGISGVKFDIGADGTASYSFESNRVPVYGNVFVKGGQNGQYNTGWANNINENTGSDLINHFIAVPDSQLVTSAVPEPSTFLLLGPALLGGMYLRRRRA